MKKALAKFLANKIMMQCLAMFSFAEGFIHIFGSLISFYGMWDTSVWDWRIAFAPAADLFFGVISLLASVVLSDWEHFHHHHHVAKKEIETNDVV